MAGPATLLVAFALVLFASRGPPAPAATAATSFAAGTLIIPMDTNPAQPSYNQNLGMWKAYGLVFRLLANGIPVHWGISLTKTATTNVDFSATVNDLDSGAVLGNWDYRGGPFIIDSADAAAAEPIIKAWWAANARQPKVHVATAPFDAQVDVTLRSPPRIAEDAVNANIAIGYFNAAGIPDANGNVWSAKSPNVFTQAQIAAGGLFEQTGAGCPRRKYDVWVSPHNGGYSYSLTDPTNLGTRAYSQLDNFVHDGGGWTALCHSIISNENAVADLTRNGSPAVKALFKTSLEGGDPGGFLTTNGFPKIDNTGGAWAVNPSSANLPVAQLVPTTGAQTLPGGSVQTWPAPGFPSSPTYWAHTEAVAGFTGTNGVVHDQIIAGTYHDGTGQGKLTFIGGHQFSTALPYAGNTNGPYLRAFYNSLLFNGAAVAKLDMQTSPATYPEFGTERLSISIVNTGGSVATNARDVGITLAPGLTYEATTAGDPPSVIDGQHLVWDSLGDVAGGATPVTIEVSVDPSFSGTVGTKQIATFHAVYGDVFGEGFTADVCRDITVTAVPAPTLTKTTETESPVATGTPVTWSLGYGNQGSADLLNAVVQDTLPQGFSFVSATPTPTNVIPAASGTILRWAVGTVPGKAAQAGTITVTARAGPVTNGEGEPPRQTFTNRATVSGADAAGAAFSQSANAGIDVQALDITLGKSVDTTFLDSLPGELTYTLTPGSNAADLLSNVRVIDPYPADLVAPPDEIGDGGTFGPYQPIPGIPGHDDGPPVLDSTLTVDHSAVTQGDTVTVTLNLHSSVAIAAVAPNDLSFTGGNATCSPTPAAANVPAGGAGTNYTWTCTLDDTGEYVFSGSGGDAAGNYAWPTASSDSILSVASGGPNVVAWDLGSTTPAHPGATIISGTTAGVFAFRGSGKPSLSRYDTTTQGWAAKANAPANVNPGGALTTDGTTVWGMSGDGKQAFWSYNPTTNVWTTLTPTGVNIKAGGALQYLNGFVYALVGNGTTGFRRYNVAANAWEPLTGTPLAVKEGGALTTDGTYIYATQGNSGTHLGFWRYDPSTNAWTVLANTPAEVKWGGALTYAAPYVYLFPGNGKALFYRYDIANDTWTALANPPGQVKDGGALTSDGTNIYALQGNGKKAFWFYDVAHNTWSTLPDVAYNPTGNPGQGAALAYVPGLNPEGYFTSLEASRSLVGDGETITVTFTIRSNFPVTGVDPGSLDTTATGGASCNPPPSGTTPTLTSRDNNIDGIDDPVTYVWTCHVAAGTGPGSLTFSDATATGTGGSAGGTVTFPGATANSTLVTPPLTFKATVPTTATSPVTDQAMIIASGQVVNSGPVSTFFGKPELTITKTSTPGADTTLVPGDPIHYTMTVENVGVATAHDVVITDPVPQHTDYVDCFPTDSCSEADGTVTWHVGTLEPGDSATVSFTVAASSGLQISDTRYTITNTASATSRETQDEPVHSDETTNTLSVLPSIVKSVSRTEAATGDTLTYTLVVENPGAEFTADVTDPLPAGTEFAGSCDPATCTHDGTVTWSGVTIPPGTSSFSFDVTVTAGGGATVTDTGTLDPTSPNVSSIDSNPAETTIGPELAIAKFNAPTGQVEHGDTISYTLVVSNESNVTAGDVTVTDPVPVGTTYDDGSCTTPDGTTCAESGGVVTWHLGDVAGGESVTLTFTVTVGTPPAGTYQIGNQAQATASNTSETVTSTFVTNPLPFASFQLTKSASRTTYSAVGDVIDYTYVVRNNSPTSTVPGNVTVTDDRVNTVTCPPGDIAPLQAITCTGSYTVTQADLDAGSVVNTATAHADGLESNPAEATVAADPNEALHLEKSITSGAPYSAIDQTIRYSYVVKNTGNVTLNDVAVRDDNVDAAPSCPGGALAPGETMTCTAVHTVTQADLDAGAVVNHAEAFVDGVTSNEATQTADATQSPGVSLTKTSNADNSTKVGDEIAYMFTVKNTGDVTITSFAVTDPLVGLTTPTCDKTSLAPDESATCTATYTVTQADVDTGVIDNKATLNGMTQTAGPVTADGSLSTQLSQDPAVTIVKSSNATAATGVDDTITYTFLVTNTGTVTITSFEVTDPLVAAINCHGVTELAPNASAPCTATYTVTQGDVNAGEITNTATVNGKTAAAGDVSDKNTLVTKLAREPGLTLVKAGTLVTTVVAPDGRADAGDQIDYTITATNTGNTTLTGVTITDDKLGKLTCDQPAQLAPTEMLVCTATYTLTQNDVNAGSVANTASVTSDQTPQKDAPSTVTVPKEPSVSLAKTGVLDTTVVTPADRADAGDVIRYTITATNTGNTTLTGVTVTDEKLGVLSCTPALFGTLLPGEKMVCTGTYTLQQGDVDAGFVDNTAAVSSDQTPIPTETPSKVTVPQVPSLSLGKTGTLVTTVVPPSGRADVGDHIDYTITATNTGNTTLTGVTIADEKLGDLTCAQPAVLAPGATLVCTARHTLTQEDIDAGKVLNTATADSTQNTPATAPSTVVVPPAPSLSLVKTGVLDTAVVAPNDRADKGDEIHYTITATNTGNTTLTDVTIADPTLELTCAQGAMLAPGESLACTGTHILTQADIEAGQVDNTATADSAANTPAEAPSTVTVPEVPSLSLAKQGRVVTTDVPPAGRADAGDHIHYLLTATNSGNTTLTGVTITDPTLGTLACMPEEPATLLPGEKLVCIANHTLTQAEIDAGLLGNTATAHSGQTPPTDASSTVRIPRLPALSLAKDAVPPAGTPSAGDRIGYTITATNSGNTTLTGVTIADTKLGSLTCSQPATLAPGEKLVCTGSYTVLQSDIDSGSVANTATANSSQNTPVDAPNTVRLPGAAALTLVKTGILDPTVVPPAGRADAGDKIAYTITATNTGTTTLTGVTVTDTKLGTLSCAQPATLAPGENLVCTGTYTLLQSDIQNGRVDNTATADSAQNTPASAPSTVPVTQAPSLSLVKSGTLDASVVAPAGRADAGDEIHYTLTATNTGNTQLTGVTIADETLGMLDCMPSESATLAPGESLVCTGTHVLTQDDIEAGHFDNTATANSSQNTPTDAPSTIPVPKAPSLTLAKHGIVVTTVVPPAGRADVGDEIHYTLTATNTGNTKLTGVTIEDMELGTLTCAQPADLLPGQKLICTGSHELTQADINTGLVHNTATARSNQTPARIRPHTVRIPRAPSLTLAKHGTIVTTVIRPADRADAGDRIDYTLTATNTGNTTLSGVTISDPKLGGLTCRPAQPTRLAPDATLVCRGSYTLTQADINAGLVDNTATVRSDETSPVDGPSTVTIPQVPSLSVAKVGVLNTSVVPPNDRADAGDAVSYTITVVNTGNTTLSGVTVADRRLGALRCTPAPPTRLAPGGKLVCTGSYTLTQADIDAGGVSNTAIARSDQTPTKNGSTTVTIPDVPLLTLVKHGVLDTAVVPPDKHADIGDEIRYTLTATNAGNVTLTGVTVSDSTLGALLVCAPPTPTSLAPGQEIECNGTHVLTQADLEAGRVDNVATVKSDQTPSKETSDPVVLPPPPAPELTLAKRAAESSYDRVGAVLHYTYAVTNTGGAPLDGPVTVVDNQTTVSCPALTTVGNGDTRLDPHETVTCTATYRVTQADLDAGRVTNTATASAGGTTSNPSSTTVGADQATSLSLVKSALPETYDVAGDTIHYSYVVTNLGNVTLAGPVTVTDNLAGVTCPAGGLAPLASMTCTAAYTITDADMQADSVTNVATAHANGTTSNQARATVIRTGTRPPIHPPIVRPSIRVTKTPATQRVVRGGTATFTITVTNTGNVPLTRVAVSDPRAPACSRTSTTLAALGSLAPGQSVSYRCSLADVRAGFTNVATATGVGPEGVPVRATGSSRVTVTTPPPARPAVIIAKGPATQTIVRGGVATFNVTVRNTSNVVLRNVTVADPRVPGCNRRFASLAPGASRSYRCTSARVGAGFDNVATVTARTPAGATVRARSTTAAVRVVPRSAAQRPALAILKSPGQQLVGRGQVARFQITIRNAGNVTLHDVRVTDSFTPSCSRSIGTLAPRRSVTYGCRSIGAFRSFVNRATAAGVSPRGIRVSARDYAVVAVRGAPLPPGFPIVPPFTG